MSGSAGPAPSHLPTDRNGYPHRARVERIYGTGVAMPACSCGWRRSAIRVDRAKDAAEAHVEHLTGFYVPVQEVRA